MNRYGDCLGGESRREEEGKETKLRIEEDGSMLCTYITRTANETHKTLKEKGRRKAGMEI
jgi:hypothetical protein